MMAVEKGGRRESVRRVSGWSASIVFMAMEVKIMLDLAEMLSLRDSLHKPQKDEGGLDIRELSPQDEEDSMQNTPNDTSVAVPAGPPLEGKDMDQYEGAHSPEEGHDPTLPTYKEAVGDDIPPPEKSLQPDGDKKIEYDPESGEPRETWGKKMDFLLSIIGYAVDLANVWRFPYLCYKNGGGAFLAPYFSVLLLGAMPVFLMEMCMGQFNRQGPITVWKISPMFKGIGFASCFMAYIVAFYYNIIIGWSFFYLFSSFTWTLPWTTCNNDWNSPDCWEVEWSNNETHNNRSYNDNTSVSSTMEFFERGVLNLHKSSGIDDLGPVRWQLALCTLLTFTLLYFCLWKGVKSTGKVVWVTATMPYIIMAILLVRGSLLPGAKEGITYFITPNLSRLGDPQVWIDAAVQIFFSVGAGFGTHIAYSSYNKFNNNCYRDCLITVAVNSFTSLFSGFVIFSYLGYMSLRTQKDISEVATEGPGLVFIVYPEAIATLTGSTGWAIIFFFMLLTLGVDSAFGGLESPLTGLRDELRHLIKYKYFRELLTLGVVGSAFMFALPCLTEGGMYVFTMLDRFAAGTSIVFTVLCQVIAVSWFYGMKQFCDDIEAMTGSRPNLYWRICWKFISPALLLIIVISSFASYTPLEYMTATGRYVYPEYANVIGWMIALSSMCMIPGYAIYKLAITKGTLKERFALCISPESEHEQIRQKKQVKRFQREHWLSV
ncbi:sodium-dependent dopamine transporter-like isoform X1 [Haliotis rufescens]|uniref:sodium-dependent dopamine transporter-like isoform X1 n=1 Tax=Haliotis rufescens TaxID=6454 RepID=UPI001EB01E99|nr:sodium-dependent dopamine transporter-like isoform X1 [Haliotis rufescens]